MNRGNVAYLGARKPMDWYFKLIGELEVSQVLRWNCTIVHGSRSLHSVQSISHKNNVFVEVHEFLCFYCCCVIGNRGACSKESHAGDWKSQTLEPVSIEDVE